MEKMREGAMQISGGSIAQAEGTASAKTEFTAHALSVQRNSKEVIVIGCGGQGAVVGDEIRHIGTQWYRRDAMGQSVD